MSAVRVEQCSRPGPVDHRNRLDHCILHLGVLYEASNDPRGSLFKRQKDYDFGTPHRLLQRSQLLRSPPVLAHRSL